MPAPPKLSEEIWLEVRRRWETDTRNGYLWLRDEMSLGVTSAAVRKRAMREGWQKRFVPFSPCRHGLHRNHRAPHKTTYRQSEARIADALERVACALESLAGYADRIVETLHQENHEPKTISRETME
jgi:hypothetical protein